MRILNYNGNTFSMIQEENFFVAYFNYIDYHWNIREVCITQQYLWRESVYIAKYSHLTTEYIWWMREVMDKVIEHYEREKIDAKK